MQVYKAGMVTSPWCIRLMYSLQIANSYTFCTHKQYLCFMLTVEISEEIQALFFTDNKR